MGVKVSFIPTSLGANTAGSFAWVLDGSDVGLDTPDEDIDAIARTADGRLVVSSAGDFSVGAVSGVSQDLFLFTATSLGETTSGAWELYLDGSDVNLANANENIWGAEIDGNGNVYLTTIFTYVVTGLSGDSDDIFTCVPGTLGETTTCTFNLYWDGDTYGVGSEWLDALAISTVPLVGSANADRTVEESDTAQNRIYLPFINR